MTPNFIDITIPALVGKDEGENGISAINTIKSIININFNDFQQ